MWTDRRTEQVSNRVELHRMAVDASRIFPSVDVASASTPRLLVVGSVVKRLVQIQIRPHTRHACGRHGLGTFTTKRMNR